MPLASSLILQQNCLKSHRRSTFGSYYGKIDPKEKKETETFSPLDWRLWATHPTPGAFPAGLSSCGQAAPGMAARPPARSTASCWCRGRGWPAPRWRRPPWTGSRWPPAWLAGGGRGRGDTQWHTDQTTQADSLDTCTHTSTQVRMIHVIHTDTTGDTLVFVLTWEIAQEQSQSQVCTSREAP